MYILSEPFRIKCIDTKILIVLRQQLKAKKANVIKGSKEDKYPPVDYTDTVQMVNESLRQPFIQKDLSVYQRDKKAIKVFKDAYNKLKQNKKMYNDTLQVLLNSFKKSNAPKWGSLIFNGERV